MGSISIFLGGYTFTELAVAGTEIAEGIETEGVEELALELAYKLVFSPSVLVDVDSTDSEVGACFIPREEYTDAVTDAIADLKGSR